MKLFLIILSSIIFFVLLLCSSLIFIIPKLIQNSSKEKTMSFFELDFAKKRIKNIKNNFFPKLLLMNKTKHWYDYSIFLNEFSKKNRILILQAINSLNKSNFSSQLFIKEESKKGIQSYWFTFALSSSENDQNIIFSVLSVNEKQNLKLIKKEDIFTSQDKYIIFLSFKFINPSLGNKKEFLNSFNPLNYQRKYKCFLFNDVLSIIIPVNNEKKLIQTRKKIINLFGDENNNYLNYFICATSLVETTKPKNNNDLNKEMTRIHFSLLKSSQLKNFFIFNESNIYFDEFENYKLELNKIITFLSNLDISKLNQIFIFDSKGSEITCFYDLTLDKIDGIFFKNKNDDLTIKNLISDSIFNLLIKNKINNSMIEINDYKIEKNILSLTENKSNIYLINFVDNYNIEIIIKLLNLLIKKEIKVCIKWSNFNNIYNFKSILNRVNLNSIILDPDIRNQIEKNDYLMIKKTCNKNGIEIIYKNPKENHFWNPKIYFNTI